MIRMIIISEQPKCKTCGIPMVEWDPFNDENEHIKCISERISASMVNMIKSQLSV